MNLSRRITGLTEDGSGGWGLYFRARRMKEAGVPMVDLTIGEHDVRTDPAILDAMHRAARGGHTGYSAIRGTPELRAAVAERVVARTGVPTGAENVMVTPGGQSGLFAALHAVLDEGDRALMIDPYYATYPGTIRAVGAQPVVVKARSRDGFQPRAEALAEHATGARSLLINSPNNPTGAVYSDATLGEIAGVCREQDLWLISDEVYDTQVWEGRHLSPRTLPGMAERTLVVGSMSKGHAMTGSRIGWVIAPVPVIDALSTLATHTTYGVAGFVQDAALFALAQGAALEERIAAPFRRRRDIAVRLIGQQNAVRAVPASGAMYVMLDIRGTGLSGNAFGERLLAEERIAVMPGESFGAASAGHIRVAMTVEDAAFEDAMARLLRFAAALCP